MAIRKHHQPPGWAMVVAVGILKPIFVPGTRRDWMDADKLPDRGGCVVVLNHISHVDPLLIAHFLYDHGRPPRYLAKSGLFHNRALGGFLKAAGQIPVERQSAGAQGAFDAAVEAVRDGECVVVYPEGTITRDPDLWPMTAKTGAARIALETGCPVVPIGQWGAHELLPPYSAKPRLLPRKTIHMKVGDPVQLDDLAGQPVTSATLQLTTTRIMDAITAIVADLRGEEPPAERFDPRRAGVRRTGNPRHRQHEREEGTR